MSQADLRRAARAAVQHTLDRESTSAIQERCEAIDERNPVVLGLAFMAACKRVGLAPSFTLACCAGPWSYSILCELLGVAPEDR